MIVEVNRKSEGLKVASLDTKPFKLTCLINWAIENVYKTSFEAQLSDYRAFNFFAKGRVTIIVGSSSAGKSTIISLLKDKLNNPFVYGLDHQSSEMGLNFVHNQKNQILHSVLKKRTDKMQFLHAILWGIFDFKEEAEVEKRKLRAKW
jgi:predicted ATPase